MYTRLLTFLRCPECAATPEVEILSSEMTPYGEEISEGLLHCAGGHWYPVVRGIPRMLPDSLTEHWQHTEAAIPNPAPDALRPLLETRAAAASKRNGNYDRRTRANFSEEWEHHDLGGSTWGMELEERVRWFFLEPLHIAADELNGKVMLDAGCGNGSQSVAYTKLGLEVIAVDLSSGLEHGHAFRSLYEGAKPARVHFIQGDLMRPPLAGECFDLIHSAGVLHHTPDTHKTFKTLRKLLRPGGTFYVWLYKYEARVTPVVNAFRRVTTRMSASAFAQLSRLMSVPFIVFCASVNKLGVRSYPRMSRRESALALMDIFGAPYAHYHDFEEVAQWYRAEGFEEIWGCNDGRRGFGVCGRLSAKTSEEAASEQSERQLTLAKG